jgi:hypothetical protein
MHMAMPDRSGVEKRAFLTMLLTWFPLLVLSLLQHRAFGSEVQMPFFYDIGNAIRFLIGLPLLVIAEAIIDPKLNEAARHYVKSGLVAREDVPAFENVIARTNRLRDSATPALVILAAAFAPLFWHQQTELPRKGYRLGKPLRHLAARVSALLAGGLVLSHFLSTVSCYFAGFGWRSCGPSFSRRR